jgi:glycosyltransferase involved in cell wall biosynthesis
VTKGTPEVSVVVATRNRAQRLRALLRSLAAQTVDRRAFEVVVVDDASSDETPSVLTAERDRGELDLTAIRHPEPGGPGGARNRGWLEAKAPIVAFIDDDCVATPGWLEAGLAACRENPGAFVQGRTEAMPEELDQLGLFSYTIRVEKLGPHFETCNILYPREILESQGGFDSEAFPVVGEDSDFAWRAIEAGARPAFAPDALVHHAVHVLGPLGQLRRAAHWHGSMLVFARHPGMRKAKLTPGVFVRREIYWKPQHRYLLPAAIGAVLPRRVRHLRAILVMPYFRNLLRWRLPDMGVPAWYAPYVFLIDIVEMTAVLRGALRYRTLVL